MRVQLPGVSHRRRLLPAFLVLPALVGAAMLAGRGGSGAAQSLPTVTGAVGEQGDVDDLLADLGM